MRHGADGHSRPLRFSEGRIHLSDEPAIGPGVEIDGALLGNPAVELKGLVNDAGLTPAKVPQSETGLPTIENEALS